MVKRLGIAFCSSAVITASLLLMMSFLLVQYEAPSLESVNPLTVDIWRKKRDETPIKKQPPAITPAEDPPVIHELNPAITQPGSKEFTIIKHDEQIIFESKDLLINNNTPTLIRSIKPIYPNKALQKGIEGYVVVEFTISRNGEVLNPRVIESDPAGYFEKAALQAISRFKYSPMAVSNNSAGVASLKKFRFSMQQ